VVWCCLLIFGLPVLGRWYRLPIIGSGLIWCVGVLLVVIRVGCSVEGTRVGGMTVELDVDVGCDTCDTCLEGAVVLRGLLPAELSCSLSICRQYVGL
jgi:hypothetical protein